MPNRDAILEGAHANRAFRLDGDPSWQSAIVFCRFLLAEPGGRPRTCLFSRRGLLCSPIARIGKYYSRSAWAYAARKKER